MEINLLFFFTAVPAIILFGIAKSGLGGSMALISIPLMTISMPLTTALGIILPILIFSDFIATYKYRKEFDLETLKLTKRWKAIIKKQSKTKNSELNIYCIIDLAFDHIVKYYKEKKTVNKE